MNNSQSSQPKHMKRKYGTENTPLYITFFQTLAEHPFITAAFLCFFCLSVTTGTKISLSLSLIPTFGVFVLGVCGAIFIASHDIKKNNKLFMWLLIAAAAAVAGLFYFLVFKSNSPAFMLLNVGMILIAGIFIYMGVTNRLTVKSVIILIFALGFLVRLVYVMYTPINVRQHDVGNFGDKSGHSAYIEYIYKHLSLPDIDVRTVSQFYHPPLHHILAAIWLKIQTAMGIKYKYACENIQILTLFYSSICMIISYKIFKTLKLKRTGLIVSCGIVAFFPTFFIMAGSINNDILSITFMLGAVLNTLYWYNEQKFRYIIAIAFCVGLGMMTKLSVWMITPAIAFIFFYVWFHNTKQNKKFISEFLTFAVICIPLGLWWATRNLIRHSVPPTYVPMLSQTSGQYIGNIPFIQRLFDFNLSQFSNVGDQFTIYGSSYNEYNPTIALFKTSMFDEGVTVNIYPQIAGFCKVLFWSAVAVAIIGFVMMIISFIKKNGTLKFPMKAFIFLLYFVMFVSYYSFCNKFAHVCTENIRYAVLLAVIGAYFVGLAVENLGSIENPKPYQVVLKRGICVVSAIFGASAILVYDIVAMAGIQ